MGNITIEHLQSSTQIINLNGLKILTDPWLTGGEYYGSWFHYPPFPIEYIEKLKFDYIFVSHIHGDHFSSNTFKKLPKKPVLIFKFQSKFLKRKIESFGFQVIELEHGFEFKFNEESSLKLFAADNCDPKLCGNFFWLC